MKARIKRIVFKKTKKKGFRFTSGVIDALLYAAQAMADIRNGRLNISHFIEDQGLGYEMGFPGFMIKLPIAKPRPRFPIGGLTINNAGCRELIEELESVKLRSHPITHSWLDESSALSEQLIAKMENRESPESFKARMNHLHIFTSSHETPPKEDQV